jgi:oxygen-independent coproporphyrinogen-3 oxidase
MTDALANELRLRHKDGFLNEEIHTIYLGGGTPSLLSEKELGFLLETISRLWTIHPQAEITLEANPEDTDKIRSTEWKKAGINRISLGVQSLFDDELTWMNRAHNAEASQKSIDILKQTGFEKFSVDLIYGSPFMTMERWEETLKWVEKEELTHLSCYGLTAEPKTPLANSIKNKSIAPLDADKMAKQFEMLMSYADIHQWEHYEISNLAKQGHQSRHNSSYWKGVPYLGIGPSAHSYNGQTRRWNIADNKKYVEQIKKGIIPDEMEVLSPTQKLNETIMVRLRCAGGCDLSAISKHFGEEKATMLLSGAGKHIGAGQMIYEEGYLKLTRKGKLFADSIAADLFFEE